MGSLDLSSIHLINTDSTKFAFIKMRNIFGKSADWFVDAGN